jgi:hypothetical protein
MGLIRKAFSISTLGMTPVGFNSKKEQIRNNTAQMAKLMATQLAYTEGTPQYDARLRAEARTAERQAKWADRSARLRAAGEAKHQSANAKSAERRARGRKS